MLDGKAFQKDASRSNVKSQKHEEELLVESDFNYAINVFTDLGKTRSYPVSGDALWRWAGKSQSLSLCLSGIEWDVHNRHILNPTLPPSPPPPRPK